jgi:plastocyanin
MKKTVIAIAIILLAGGAVYYAINQNQVKAPTEETSQNNDQATNSPQPSPSPTSGDTATSSNNSGVSVDVGGTTATGTFSSGEEIDGGPDIQVMEITYDGSKYSPNQLTIKVNDYIIFKNNSNTDFWPASAPHPSHTNFPEFDAKKPIAPGGTFRFQFTKTGSWGFHDHLNPSAFGKITVNP